MTLSYTAALKNNRLDEMTTAIGASGFLRIYDGVEPADADTALSGNTLLAELPLSATYAPAASGGVLTASAITDDSSADATGTASFYRLVTSAGAAVMQGTVGTSGQELNLNTLSIAIGAVVSVTSHVTTAGN